MDTTQLFERMVRAARLDQHLYEEVEADTGAMSQAMLVVVLSALAAGVGVIGRVGIGALLLNVVLALLSWCVWAFLTYWIGTRILPEAQTRADLGQLLRTLGFAASPGLIRIVGIIGPLAPLATLVASVWMLAAMVVAVRQALDYSGTMRAVGVCVIGWLVQLIILIPLLMMVGNSGMGSAGG
jgi:hypothetical protein